MIIGFLVFVSQAIRLTGIANGDVVVGEIEYQIQLERNLDDFIGLEVFVGETSVGYFSEPPFEGRINLGPFPSGELQVRVVARFFGDRTYTALRTINHVKNAYEQTVHLIQIPITFDAPLHEKMKPEWFQLRVGGQLKKVSQVWGIESPLDLVILLDTSGSMEDRLPVMRGLIREFLEQLSKQDRVKVIGFYHNVYEISDFDEDKSDIPKKLLMIRPGGDTNLYGALWAGISSLSKAERRRGILLLTDGQHQMDIEREGTIDKTLEETLSLARKYMVPVSVLGIGSGIDPSVLEQITAGTGGRFFQNIKFKHVRENFNTFLADLRQQYVLGYYHQGDQSGWKDIEIQYSGPKGKIRFCPKKIYIK